MAFIGRPQIPWDQFRREDLPGTGETLVNTLSQILQNYTANQQMQNRNAIPIDQAVASGLVPEFTGGRTVNLPDGTPITIGQTTPARETYGPQVRGPIADFLTKKRAEESAMERAMTLQGVKSKAELEKGVTMEGIKSKSELKKSHTVATDTLLNNYPSIKKMGFTAGDMIPDSILAAHSKSDEAKRLPPSTVLTLNEGKTVARLIPEVTDAINQNASIFGPIEGTARGLNPYDKKAKTVDARMRSASQAYGRFMEGGVLRKEDEEKYRKMFPQLSDTPEIAKNKLSIAARQLIQKYEDDKNTMGRSGYDVSGFETLNIPESLFGESIPLTGGKGGTSKYSGISTEELMKKAMEQINGKR